MKLIYDIDDIYVEPPEVFSVKVKHFVYEVDDDGSYEELKQKYYKRAVAQAAYNQISEYANFEASLYKNNI